MSNPTTLADVLKSSPEVTSLDLADRLIAVGADGATKRISEDNLVYPNYRLRDFPSTNTDWVRIASTPEDTPAVATVYFTNGYWAGGPSGLAVVFSTRYENGSWVKPGVRFISGNNPYLLIRTVKIGTSFHLDVKGYSRRLIVCCEGINVFVPDTLETPTIPADATIYTYTSAELSGGGVKRCASISCKRQQKGGQRDGRRYSTGQRPPERSDGRRHGVPRIILQHRRVQISGNLWWKRGSGFRDIAKFSRHRRLALWKSGSDQRETAKNPPTAVLRKWRCSREGIERHVAPLEVDDILALGKEVAA